MRGAAGPAAGAREGGERRCGPRRGGAAPEGRSRAGKCHVQGAGAGRIARAGSAAPPRPLPQPPLCVGAHALSPHLLALLVVAQRVRAVLLSALRLQVEGAEQGLRRAGQRQRRPCLEAQPGWRGGGARRSKREPTRAPSGRAAAQPATPASPAAAQPAGHAAPQPWAPLTWCVRCAGSGRHSAEARPQAGRERAQGSPSMRSSACKCTACRRLGGRASSLLPVGFISAASGLHLGAATACAGRQGCTSPWRGGGLGAGSGEASRRASTARGGQTVAGRLPSGHTGRLCGHARPHRGRGGPSGPPARRPLPSPPRLLARTWQRRARRIGRHLHALQLAQGWAGGRRGSPCCLAGWRGCGDGDGAATARRCRPWCAWHQPYLATEAPACSPSGRTHLARRGTVSQVLVIRFAQQPGRVVGRQPGPRRQQRRPRRALLPAAGAAARETCPETAKHRGLHGARAGERAQARVRACSGLQAAAAADWRRRQIGRRQELPRRAVIGGAGARDRERALGRAAALSESPMPCPTPGLLRACVRLPAASAGSGRRLAGSRAPSSRPGRR